MADNEDEENLSSSSDDENSDSTSSSSSLSSDDDDDDDDEQVEEESDDNFSSLTPKQAYLLLETKRKTLGKRLLELRDELKAQPQADIEAKKRLLTEIKNLREKWIAVQTRLTNVKARLSHSSTPERKIPPKPLVEKPVEVVAQSEIRIIPPPRLRQQSYSSSDRSRSASRDSRSSTERSYHDLDALDGNGDSKRHDALSSRPTTSYRDLIENRSIFSSPSPSSIDQPHLEDFPLEDSKQLEDNFDEQEENSKPKETFYNQNIPYPVINDKRDVEVINRQLKNQLRELEASRNNPLYDQQSNVMHYERLKKQNEYINLRIRIEKLKKSKAKTQREKEQNKKQFQSLVQEFRKLQRFMRSANRGASNNLFLTFANENFPTMIPLPPSPEPKEQPMQPKQQQQQQQQEVEVPLPPLDLHKVTGKKIIFESSDSEDEETTSEPQVPVSLSASEPRAVPDGFNQNQPPPLPMPSSSSSLVTLNAFKTRVANLINIPNASTSEINQSESTNKTEGDGGEDDDDDEDDQPPVIRLERTQAISAKFNRKRRKTKRNRNKKKNANNTQTNQPINDENDVAMINQEEAWKRHVAMQLQSNFLKQSNPISRALAAEAYKKLGINPEEMNDFQFDDEMMDYETALILQQQREFLAAAAANPFNVLHSAAAGNSSSRPNLVDILSNLNGGVPPSPSEPQTPMGLLQKFFLDANNNSNTKYRGSNVNLNDLSSTPPTPPPPRDPSIGKKIVESLTHQDINALLKLSGSEHDDDDDDDDDDDENQSFNGDTDDDNNNFSFDEDSNDLPNGNSRNYDRWERPIPIPSRQNQPSNITNKKSTIESLILPSFNRCTHLGKSTKRTAGVERMFPSFSKHNTGPSSTLSLILYGLSSTP